MRKRRLSDPGTLVLADVTPAAASASEHAASTQEIPMINDAYEMHVLNEGNDEDIIQYEIDELNEREMELWDTVQMPEVRYDDPWRDVYRLTNVHLAHSRIY